MKILITEKLSENKYIDNKGFLVCRDAIIARTGKQTYKMSDILNTDGDDEVEVDRPSTEVFSAETLASFENCPITYNHPSDFVSPENFNELAIGFVRDVKKAVIDEREVITASLVFTNKEAIEDITSGKIKELSCGYDCDIKMNDNGEYIQTNIRGNHLALCESGRAGIAMIRDSTNSSIVEDSRESEGMTIEDIAKKHNVSVEKIKEQIRKGIEIEYEHTDSREEAERIAMDHLTEIPDYYDKLEKMEAKDFINDNKSLGSLYYIDNGAFSFGPYKLTKIISSNDFSWSNFRKKLNKLTSHHPYRGDIYELTRTNGKKSYHTDFELHEKPTEKLSSYNKELGAFGDSKHLKDDSKTIPLSVIDYLKKNNKDIKRK